MPATGVRPPAFTFVAVRAIAPVAGRPRKSGEAMLAAPCEINSAFDLCAPPIIRSATVAESSDSMPARNAMVSADGSRSTARSVLMGGICGVGRPFGKLPYLAATVSTVGNATTATTLAAMTTNTSHGIFGASFRRIRIAARLPIPSASAAGSTVSRMIQSPLILGRKSAGSAPPSSRSNP